MQRGEASLDVGDTREAFRCFKEAVSADPTNQTAWCTIGVTASELWEEGGDEMPSGKRRKLLETACGSFDKVFVLDTSKRSENRSLACLSLARLSAKVAVDLDDAGGNAEALAEALCRALRHFEEAERLEKAWSVVDLDSEVFGAWGECLSHKMRFDATAVQLSLAASSAAGADVEGLWGGQLEHLDALRQQASTKFGAAVNALDAGGDEEGTRDDPKWLTLQVEHSIAFVEIACQVLLDVAAPWSEVWAPWREAAKAAWDEAHGQVGGLLHLAGGWQEANWKLLSLAGDLWVAGAKLLASTRTSGSTLCVKHWKEPVEHHAETPVTAEMATRSLEDNQVHMFLGDCVRAALAAYREATVRGGRPALGTADLAIGDLLLDCVRWHSRLRDASGLELTIGHVVDGSGCLSLDFCRIAEEALHEVAGLPDEVEDDPDDCRATACYNLACAAGLRGDAAAAGQALRRCFVHVASADNGTLEVAKWRCEAVQDADLAAVRGDPDVCAALAA